MAQVEVYALLEDAGVHPADHEVEDLPLLAVVNLDARGAFTAVDFLLSTRDMDVARALQKTAKLPQMGERMPAMTILEMVIYRYLVYARGADDAMAIGLFDLLLHITFRTEAMRRFWLDTGRPAIWKMASVLAKISRSETLLPLLIDHLPDEFFTEPEPEDENGLQEPSVAVFVRTLLFTLVAWARTDITEAQFSAVTVALHAFLERTPDSTLVADGAGWIVSAVTLIDRSAGRSPPIIGRLREAIFRALVVHMDALVDVRAIIRERMTRVDQDTMLAGYLTVVPKSAQI